MLVPSFLVTTLLALEGAEVIAYCLTEHNWIRTNRGGGRKNFLGPGA